MEKISLLSNIGKTFDKLILTRIKIAIIVKIRPEYHGFRPYHSIIVHLTKVLRHIINNANLRHKTAATILNIKKAFDKVWHEGLIYKLLAMEVPY